MALVSWSKDAEWTISDRLTRRLQQLYIGVCYPKVSLFPIQSSACSTGPYAYAMTFLMAARNTCRPFISGTHSVASEETRHTIDTVGILADTGLTKLP